MYALDELEITAPDFTSGNCHNQAPLWDYDIAGEETEDRDARFDRSLTLCDTCPLRAQCRAYADEEDLSGLWGGQIIPPKANATMFVRCARCRIPVHRKRKDNALYQGIDVYCRACSHH